MDSFHPSDLAAIPPPTLAELRQVWADVSHNSAPRAPLADVRSALEVNELDLPSAHLELALRCMVTLSAPPSPHPADGAVHCDAFCRCLHALSQQQRDVLPRALYAVFPDSAFVSEAGAERLQLRRAIWLALEDPLSSNLARCLSLLIVAAILLSTVAFCVETLPGVHMRHTPTFYGIEAACVLVFTLEFVLRAACTPYPQAFLRSPLNWVDLAAIAPFFVELGLSASGNDSALGSSAILRAVRLVRVFRMLKVGRYLALMRVFVRTLALSLAPLGMVGYVAVIAVLLTTSSEYFAEGSGAAAGVGLGGEKMESDAGRLSNFASIPSLFWWCIITQTGGAFCFLFYYYSSACLSSASGALRSMPSPHFPSSPSLPPLSRSGLWRRLPRHLARARGCHHHIFRGHCARLRPHFRDLGQFQR